MLLFVAVCCCCLLLLFVVVVAVCCCSISICFSMVYEFEMLPAENPLGHLLLLSQRQLCVNKSNHTQFIIQLKLHGFSKKVTCILKLEM